MPATKGLTRSQRLPGEVRGASLCIYLHPETRARLVAHAEQAFDRNRSHAAEALITAALDAHERGEDIPDIGKRGED